MTANRTLNVGLVQINNSFSGQNYFPYSVGILQAYAERHLTAPGDTHFLRPLYKREQWVEMHLFSWLCSLLYLKKGASFEKGKSSPKIPVEVE